MQIEQCTQDIIFQKQKLRTAILIDEKNFFDQPVKSIIITYDNIRKIAISHGDDYTAVCLQDHDYLNKQYKFIAVDLSK